MQTFVSSVRAPLVLGLGLALTAGPVSGQARALLREGDALVGSPGQTVSALNNTAVNQVGGFAATVSSTGGATLSHVWGNAAGGPGALLRTEGLVGIYQQSSFESFFGISDAGAIAYSPSSDDTVGGTTGLDGVWVDDTILALEDQPIPSLAGKMWRFGSRPSISANGTAFWVGGINDIATGAAEGNGLFSGPGATPLVKTGDVIAGLPAPLGSSAIDFDFRVSALGTNWIGAVDTTAASSADAFVLINGAAVTLAGNLLGEGQPIDASIGGLPGENWASFDYFGIAESGDYLFTGDTGGDTATDEFVAKNGSILYREGDVLDGETLTGSIEGAFMNEAGDIAFIWDIDDGAGGSLEALYLGDRLLLTEGDEVDWDGDGFVDAGVLVDNFTGITALTLGADRALYFTADVVVPGAGVLEGFFCLPYDCLSAAPYALSASAGGTMTLDLDAGVANAGSLYFVAGSGSGTSPGVPLGGFTLPLFPDPFFNTTLNKPNSSALMNTLGVLDVDGRGQASINVPPGLAPAGGTFHWAYAVFDLGPLTFKKTSGAVSLVFRP